MKVALKLICLICAALVTQSIAQSKEASKVDEFEDFTCESAKFRTFQLLQQLKDQSGSRGYIIIYEGKYLPSAVTDKYVLPRIGEANARISLIKAHIKFLQGSSAPITFMLGGFRERLTAEYFVVPAGAPAPKPSSTLKTIKHRRGQPKLYVNPAEC